MQTPPPVASITSAEEYERARREATRLTSAKPGSVDDAVRIALLDAIAVWEGQARRVASSESADSPTDEKGPVRS